VPPLTWHIDTGPASAHVAVHGRPDDRSVTALRGVLEKYCGRSYGCLTIDLSALSPADHAVLAASSLPAGHSAMSSGTALLLCGEDFMLAGANPDHPGLHARMSRHFARACDALTVGPLRSPSFAEQLLPVSGAARRSRDLVSHAVRTWDLAHLSTSASMIVSELVSHTIRHASTIMTVTVVLHRGVVYLWVRGGNRSIPTSPPTDKADNLELELIHTLADHWGFLLDHDDMVIWAALPAFAARPSAPAPSRRTGRAD
jgi:hypothetical protein